MRGWQSQAHVKHYCRYHVAFVPKYRGTLRKDIGSIFKDLWRQYEIELVEGHCNGGSRAYVTDDPSEA